MKHIKPLTLAALALLATPLARAWNYTDGDLLLVFRESGASDVEFDLGSVNTYLGHTNGYTTTVTGWNPTLVTSAFASSTNINTFGSLTGVSVALLATTPVTNAVPTAWLSGAEPNTTAYRVGAQAWSSRFHNIISAVGTRPVFYNIPATTNANATATNSYVVSAGSLASYDYTVTGGNQQAVSLLGGNANFTVETTIPADLDFWAISPSSASPKPADQLVGRFVLSANGVLTFIAGPRASTLQSVARSGNVSTIQFTTTVGNTYTLAHTNNLTAPVATWPVDTTTITGDGNVDSISRTNAGSAEFYEVIAR